MPGPIRQASTRRGPSGREERLDHARVVAGGPHRAVALLELGVRHGGGGTDPPWGRCAPGLRRRTRSAPAGRVTRACARLRRRRRAAACSVGVVDRLGEQPGRDQARRGRRAAARCSAARTTNSRMSAARGERLEHARRWRAPRARRPRSRRRPARRGSSAWIQTYGSATRTARIAASRRRASAAAVLARGGVQRAPSARAATASQHGSPRRQPSGHAWSSSAARVRGVAPAQRDLGAQRLRERLEGDPARRARPARATPRAPPAPPRARRGRCARGRGWRATRRRGARRRSRARWRSRTRAARIAGS